MTAGFTRVIIEMAFDTMDKAIDIDMPKCKFCQSTAVVKNGTRNAVQYYICKECGRGFVYNKGLPRMRYSTEIVADAVYDYYAGVSLKKTREGNSQKIRSKPAHSATH